MRPIFIPELYKKTKNAVQKTVSGSKTCPKILETKHTIDIYPHPHPLTHNPPPFPPSLTSIHPIRRRPRHRPHPPIRLGVLLKHPFQRLIRWPRGVPVPSRPPNTPTHPLPGRGGGRTQPQHIPPLPPPTPADTHAAGVGVP